MTAVETLRAAILARAFTHSFPPVTVDGQTIEHENGWRNYTRSATAQELNDLEDALMDWMFGIDPKEAIRAIHARLSPNEVKI